MNALLFLAICDSESAIISGKIGAGAAAFAVGITVALILSNVRQGGFGWLPLYGVIIVLHPTWTLGVQRGDCGYSLRFLGVAASLILLAIFYCQLFWPHLNKRRFTLTLCVLAWAAYFVAWPVEAILARTPAKAHLEGGGFLSEGFLSFMSAGKDLLLASLALSVVCLLQGLFHAISRRRSLQSPVGQAPSQELAGTNQQLLDSELRPPWRSNAHLRILSCLCSLLLLGWVLVSVVSSLAPFGANPVFSILALAWAVILIITALRGRFPGWS